MPETMASKRELLKMADMGLGCNDSNSRHFVEYFDLFIGHNEIPKVEMKDRLGKIKNKFIHPITSEDIHVMAKDSGESQLLKSFQTKGTAQSWINNVFNLIKNHPKAVFPIVSSFASAILHEEELKPIVIDVSVTSSTGKSGLLRLCASVWREPPRSISAHSTQR